MDANVTASQSEHDHDNSSLQNPSTNPAEAGTTDETRDEDHETSSIEALNWSEVEEEELAAAQQATLAASAARGNLPPKNEEETKVNNKADKDDESGTNNGSSTANDEGSVLSTTLLQSINSSVSDEDPQARKQSVIENWAEEVTNAVERGEIEMTEDFPDDNGTTGDDEEEEGGNADSNGGVRKRKGKKVDMVSSMMSATSNGESSVDPLSNAPVLDDGPIWNKGPRSYTFQENRRINQKLTFCLLIAVVLAIGLGLGNLVAHQECEAEYKASQQSQPKHTDKISVHTVPTTTTPAPIIPDKFTDSSMMGSSLPPRKQATSDSANEKIDNDDLVTLEQQMPDKRQIPVKSYNEARPRRRDDEPVIDPKYKTHAETVSSVVHTLDRLSRQIDQFENTTRKLQGVLMIPDEEKSAEEEPKESISLYDEQVHIDEDGEGYFKNENEAGLLDGEKDEIDEEDDEENEQAIIEDLIEAIEQTPDYLERKMHEKRLEKLQELRKDLPHSKVWSHGHDGEVVKEKDPTRDHDIEMLLKSIKQFKDFERRFVKSERKRLRDEGKYDRLSWRLPEEYTTEEKNALQVRYRSNWQEFLKLIKSKVPDPIEALFGVEEEDKDERTYGDLLYFPFPDPDRDLTDEEADALVKKNLDASVEAMKIKPSDKEDVSQTTNPEQLIANTGSGANDNLEEIDDDLIITESTEDQVESIESARNSDSSHHEQVTDDGQDQVAFDNSIIGKLIEESPKVHADHETPLKPKKSAIEVSNDKLTLEKVKREALAKSSKLKSKKSPNNKLATHDAAKINEKRWQEQAQTASIKNGKRDQKQKEQKGKQGKQKGKNGGSLSGSSGNNVVKDAVSGSSGKMSSKGKKLKNLESNKVFENIKGKSVDKRRGASSETQRQGKFGAETKHSEPLRKRKNEGNPERKSTPTGSTNNNKRRDGGGHSDTTSAANEKQKLKQTQQQQHYHQDNDNQKTKINSNNQQNGGSPKHYESKDIRGEQKRQQRRESQNNEKKNKSDFPSEKKSAKPSQETKDSFSKETQYRQQKAEFKRSKNTLNKEKVVDRREKPREKVSSWGN